MLSSEIEAYLKAMPPSLGVLRYREYIYTLLASVKSKEELILIQEEKIQRLEKTLSLYIEEVQLKRGEQKGTNS